MENTNLFFQLFSSSSIFGSISQKFLLKKWAKCFFIFSWKLPCNLKLIWRKFLVSTFSHLHQVNLGKWVRFLHSPYRNCRSSRPEVFGEKGVPRNFAKFTGKHLWQSLFFNKVAGLRPTTLLKKRLCHKSFPVNLRNFSEHRFLKNAFAKLGYFKEHPWSLLLKLCYMEIDIQPNFDMKNAKEEKKSAKKSF